MKNKFAQDTKLDKIKDDLLDLPKSYIRHPSKQIQLDFDNYQINQDIEESHKELKEKKKLEPINFNYPEIQPEHIKYRQLSKKEIENLVEEDNDNYRRHLNNPYRKDEPFIPTYQKYYDLNKELPEDIKKKILEKYNEFKAVAIIFQQKYKEANTIAEQEVELNYDGTYIDLFKNLAKFIIAASRRHLGALFGIYPEKNSDNIGKHRSVALINFINNGLNIFNITPLNFAVKIHDMETATHNMSLIIKEYDRRFKILKKLNQIEVDVKRFLLKKENREFLKWMDEYFSNDKQEFFSGIVNRILSDSLLDNGFTIGNLGAVRTYQDIYWKARQATTLNQKYILENKVKEDINEKLRELISDKISPRLKEFENFMGSLLISHEDDAIKKYLDSIIKYIYKNFRFDMRGIFSFVQTTIKNYYSEEDNAGLENKLKVFILEFASGLKDKLYNEITSSDLNLIVSKILSKYNKEGVFDYKNFSLLTEKDLNEFINDYFKIIITNSMPNFSRRESYNLPIFTPVSLLIENTGKLSPDSIAEHINRHASIIPKEFALHLAKFVIKNGKVDIFRRINDISRGRAALAAQVALNILKKSNKYNADSFTNLFISDDYDSIQMATNEFEYRNKLNDKDILEIFSYVFRNTSTIERDRENFNKFNNSLHNNTNNLTKQELINIFSNKNYVSYNKIGIVKKLFDSYAMIRNMGGLNGIYKKYGNLISAMKENGFISKNFDTNIRIVIREFNSNKDINPSNPNFNKLFEITSTLETDLEAVEMGEALTDMIKNYQKKDDRLFKLDLQVNNNLRFRVLQDKDPRMLRVGIESNCCQRIGGVGEVAARDSFVNPLAGVLVLEWKDRDGKYVLLAQSYFHYVPKTNGYILDNIETNSQNVSKSLVDLSAAYAYLAQHSKEKFNIGYFLSGKGYSKLNTDNFATYKMKGGDPRYFDNNALTEDNKSFYTDFKPQNAMNLLSPKFDYDKRLPKLINPSNEEERKNAFDIHLPRILKIALRAA